MTEINVSVIIPAYNCSHVIVQAIESALKQDVSVELLVINDCSPDNLDETMKVYSNEPRIRYLKNNTNLGVAATRNKGVSLARGKYVAFLDADDWWSTDKLKIQVHALEQSGAVICSTARELVTPEGNLTGKIIPVSEVIQFESLLKNNCINCSSVLLPTKVAKEFPMEHDDAHEDYITWLRILKGYGEGIGINKPLLKYRISTTGKSGNKFKSARMTFKVYRIIGFGFLRSIYYFSCYALNGIRKYW